MTPDKDVAAAAVPNGDLYLYEFLYRGRAPGAVQAPDYHVVLAQDVTDAFGATSTSTSQAMTPAQAGAMGFELPTIIAAIDASTMAENADLRAHADDLQTKLDAALTDIEGMRGVRDAARAETTQRRAQFEPAESPTSTVTAPGEPTETAPGV